MCGDADAAALVAAEVDDDAAALRGDLPHRGVELRAAVAAARAEHVAGQALAVDPDEHRLAGGGDVTAHEREVRLVVALGAERQAPERTALRRQAGVGDAVDDGRVTHRAPSVAPSPDPSARRPRGGRRRRTVRARRASIVGAPGPRNSADGVVAAEHRRGEVDDVAVDEPGGVDVVGDGGAALDEQLQHAAPAELVEDRAEVAAALQARVDLGARRRAARARRAADPGPSTWRTVSDGSSARTVPAPTRIAWLSARRRWASARASGPVIHWLVPSGAAMRPSTVAASLSTT